MQWQKLLRRGHIVTPPDCICTSIRLTVMVGSSVVRRAAIWAMAIVNMHMYKLSNICTSVPFNPMVDTVFQCLCPVCRMWTNSPGCTSKFIVRSQATSCRLGIAGLAFFKSFCEALMMSSFSHAVWLRRIDLSGCLSPNWCIHGLSNLSDFS